MMWFWPRHLANQWHTLYILVHVRECLDTVHPHLSVYPNTDPIHTAHAQWNVKSITQPCPMAGYKEINWWTHAWSSDWATSGLLWCYQWSLGSLHLVWSSEDVIITKVLIIVNFFTYPDYFPYSSRNQSWFAQCCLDEWGCTVVLKYKHIYMYSVHT